MLSAYLNCFKIPELKKRLLFTFAMIALVQLTAAIPCPGIDPVRLKELFNNLNSNAGSSGIMGMLSLFSGGAMEKFAIGALGIMPYISASIILQLMTPVIPALSKMTREGESGMQQYNFIMRVMTVIVAIIQGIMFSVAMMEPSRLGLGELPVVFNPGPGFMIQTIIILVGGSMFITWLGEMVTERGVGNGASLIITVNIVARIPSALVSLYQMVFVGSATGESQLTVIHLAILVALFIAVTVGAIVLTEGMRKIPVHANHLRRRNPLLLRGHPAISARQRSHAVAGNPLPVRLLRIRDLLRRTPYALRILLGRKPVQPNPDCRRLPEEQRIHPRHPPRKANQRLPRPRNEPHHAGRSTRTACPCNPANDPHYFIPEDSVIPLTVLRWHQPPDYRGRHAGYHAANPDLPHQP